MKQLLLAGLLSLAPAFAGGAATPPPAATLRMTAPGGTAFTMRARTSVTMRVTDPGNTDRLVLNLLQSMPAEVEEMVMLYRVRRTPQGAELIVVQPMPLSDGREGELRSVQVFSPAGELLSNHLASDEPELASFVDAINAAQEALGDRAISMYEVPLRAGAERSVRFEEDFGALMVDVINMLFPEVATAELMAATAVTTLQVTTTALGPQPGGFGFRTVMRGGGVNLKLDQGGDEVGVALDVLEDITTEVYDAQGLPLRSESRMRILMTMSVSLPSGKPMTLQLEQVIESTTERE